MAAKKKKTQNPKIDRTRDYTAFTDGACSGNPGPMGIGGIIYCGDEIVSTFSIPSGQGTNNDAEYNAIIKALEIIKELKPDSFTLCSDSELAVYQINGWYKINKLNLSKLNAKVQKLLKEINCDHKVMWISRTQNEEADALASKAAGMPQAKIDGNVISFWQKDESFIVDPLKICLLEAPNARCQESINKINALENPKFGDFINVKSFGADKYSRLKSDRLKEIIETRFGTKAVLWITDTVGDAESEYGKEVMKWVARGIMPDRALKKVSVDKELASNYSSRRA